MDLDHFTPKKAIEWFKLYWLADDCCHPTTTGHMIIGALIYNFLLGHYYSLKNPTFPSYNLYDTQNIPTSNKEDNDIKPNNSTLTLRVFNDDIQEFVYPNKHHINPFTFPVYNTVKTINMYLTSHPLAISLIFFEQFKPYFNLVPSNKNTKWAIKSDVPGKPGFICEGLTKSLYVYYYFPFI